MARSTAPELETTPEGYLFPLPKGTYRYRGGFGMRKHPILGYLKMHTGGDWAAPMGTPIFAPASGKIKSAGWVTGYGNFTELEGKEKDFNFGHQASFAKGIEPGVHVRQGQIIGYVGSTGLSTGSHLHFEVVQKNGVKIDPMPLCRKALVVTAEAARDLATGVVKNLAELKEKIDGGVATAAHAVGNFTDKMLRGMAELGGALTPSAQAATPKPPAAVTAAPPPAAPVLTTAPAPSVASPAPVPRPQVAVNTAGVSTSTRSDATPSSPIIPIVFKGPDGLTSSPHPAPPPPRASAPAAKATPGAEAAAHPAPVTPEKPRPAHYATLSEHQKNLYLQARYFLGLDREAKFSGPFHSKDFKRALAEETHHDTRSTKKAAAAARMFERDMRHKLESGPSARASAPAA